MTDALAPVLVPVTIDVELRRHFSTLEHALFFLIRSGFRNIHSICDILFIFSEEVIAAALERLVQAQVISIDLSTATVTLSPGLGKLLAAGSREYNVILWPESYLDESGVYIAGRRDVVSAILDAIDSSPEFKALVNAVELLLIREDKHIDLDRGHYPLEPPLEQMDRVSDQAD